MSESRRLADLSDVHALMAQAVAAPEPALAPLYGWLRYHLGWAEIDGTPAQRRTAKGVRPRACLLAAAATGGNPAQAIPCAAAVELTHEFSLIHDDIQDGDKTRRGRPTLWTEVGEAQAIGAGDLLWAIARRLLGETRVAPERLVDLQRRYDRACARLAEGQHLDLAFEQRDDVTPADYRLMIAGKTGALLGLATALGAGAADASASVMAALGRFGETVGVAFQMRDDWLGLWGDPAHTGKPVAADLIRRKKSLPILLALGEPELGDRLRALLSQSEIAPAEATRMARTMAEAGIGERVEAEAGEMIVEARTALAALSLEAEPSQALDDLARRAVDRAR